jgi:hypothetical protein
VPGMHWLGLILVGAAARADPPLVAAMRWWSSRAPHADQQRKQEAALRLASFAAWGSRVIHVFDRGFAGSPWLHLCFALRQRLIVRWPHRQYLIDKKCGPKHKPARSSSPMHAAGTLKGLGDLTRVSWGFNVHACARGGTATNGC